MFRLHFTADDLARVRVTRGGGPLAETQFSLARLWRRDPRDPLKGWAARVARSPSGLVHPCAALFEGGRLDILSMAGPAGSIEEALTNLLAVPAGYFRAELAAATVPGGFSGDRLNRLRRPDAAGDPAGDRADRRRLATFLHDYYQVAVAPHWSQIQARLSTQHAALTHALATGGVEGLLAALAPFARWRPPVLEIGSGSSVDEMSLDGRGLTIVPSVFYEPGAAVAYNGLDEQAPVVLSVPATRGPGDLTTVLTAQPGVNRLAAVVSLLGRTRAHALDRIGTQGSCSTGELARRLGISPASASEHTTVLRDAGLVTTTRQGREVRHRLTTLGRHLLDGTA